MTGKPLLNFRNRLTNGRTFLLAWKHQDIVIAIGLGALVIFFGFWLMTVGVCGIFHDDGIYVSTAKALAQGDGYRLINLPDSPLQTKYPILYPALLAVIWKLWPSFPDNLLAMQGLSLFAGAATVALVFLYLVSNGYSSRGIAITSGLFCASSAWFLYFSTLTISEIPFALLTVIALWTVERSIRIPIESSLFKFTIGVLLALPFLTRIIGIVLVPISLILLYRAGRSIRLIALGSAAVVVPWIFWMLIGPKWNQNQVAAYYTNYLSWWSSFGLPNLIRIFLYNLLMVAIQPSQISFAIFHNIKEHPWLFSITPFIGVMIFGSIILHIRSGRLLPCFLAAYLAIILLWPWPPFRFLVSILPFLLAYLIGGIWRLVHKYPYLIHQKWLLMAFLGLLLIINIGSIYRVGRINEITKYQCVVPPTNLIYWSSYESMFNWLSTHTKSTDVIASGLDTMMYLYTERRSIRPFAMSPDFLFYGKDSKPFEVEDLVRILKSYRAKFLVDTPMLGFAEEKPFSDVLHETQRQYPDQVKTVYIGEDNRFKIFQLNYDSKSFNQVTR